MVKKVVGKSKVVTRLSDFCMHHTGIDQRLIAIARWQKKQNGDVREPTIVASSFGTERE